MAASAQASAKRTTEASRTGASSGIAIRERAPNMDGSIQPSKGAEDVYVQARTLFKAMVQMPHYSEEVGILGLPCMHRFEMSMRYSYHCEGIVQTRASTRY